jgi:hypothetical protein
VVPGLRALLGVSRHQSPAFHNQTEGVLRTSTRPTLNILDLLRASFVNMNHPEGKSYMISFRVLVSDLGSVRLKRRRGLLNADHGSALGSMNVV